MAEPDSVGAAEVARSRAASIARGAGVIAGLTVLARILGLVRTLVFSQTVGATCLGTAYFTANQVPNLVYELVLGGALGSAMVPVLARSAERARTDPAEKAHVSQITSALLTWTIVIVGPLTLVVVVGAGPISAWLTPANSSAQCVHAALVATTADMLRVFAPQALLYGLTVVLFGLLQAYRRFAGYALAPLVSSLVLIASYVAFAPLGQGLALSRLSDSAKLLLSGGATLGVVAMVVVGLVPTWRLRLRLRPALRFPPGVARRAGGLMMVGLVEMAVMQISAIAVIAMANGRGDTGALVMFNYASQVFNSLNAVLGLSIVLSAFPVLSARDGDVFDSTCAGSTRAVSLAACLGVAVIGAVAVPAAHVLARTPEQVPQLVAGFALFAPGLVGAGVVANLTRAMLATGRLKVACVAVSGGSLLATVAEVVLAAVVPSHLVVGALAFGSTIGWTGAAIPLVIVTRRIRGEAAVRGVTRATLSGLAAATAGTAVGVMVSVALPESGKLLDAAIAAIAVTCAVAAFGVVAFRLDDGDLRVVMARLRAAVRFGPAQTRRRGDGGLFARTRGRVMNAEDRLAPGDGAGRPGFQMGRTERQGALAIGLAAGIAGGFAVFVSSNQAGTAVLLVISLVFLLAGTEGTALLRTRGLRVAPSGRRSLERSPHEPDGQWTDLAAPEAALTPAARSDAVSYQDSVIAALTDDLPR